jgi:uncharacterized protein (TIGR02246 family)
MNMTTTAAGPTVDADVEQIRRLAHDYAHAVDGGRLDGIVAVFTPDAVWDTSAVGGDVSQGLDEIRAYFAASAESLPATVHMTTNHIVDVDGDAATGTSYFHAVFLDAAGTRHEALGRYEDTYARTSDGWKVQRRIVQPLLAPSTA